MDLSKFFFDRGKQIDIYLKNWQARVFENTWFLIHIHYEDEHEHRINYEWTKNGPFQKDDGLSLSTDVYSIDLIFILR